MIQKRDKMFSSHHPNRFKSHLSKAQGASLIVDGKLVTDPLLVLVENSPIWASLAAHPFPPCQTRSPNCS